MSQLCPTTIDNYTELNKFHSKHGNRKKKHSSEDYIPLLGENHIKLSKMCAELTITLSIAFSSQMTSADDTCVGLLPSSCILLLEDIVTWEDPWVQVSAFDFVAASVSKGLLTSFKEPILKSPSKGSLHI